MGKEGHLDIDSLIPSVFRIRDDKEFNVAALKIFHHQHRNNLLYREFCDLLMVAPCLVATPAHLPFMPVEFFRDHEVVTGSRQAGATIFTSSGTTTGLPARHIVPDITLYEQSFMKAFSRFYGDPGDFTFLALLPGYLERPGSSLIYMMDHLIRATKDHGSAFYLDDLGGLQERIRQLKKEKRRILLFGVSYALLDMAERYPVDLAGHIVMETGGMKGRRKEMIREELHGKLCQAFHIEQVHSEYGMTELMSQAYSRGGGRFHAPPWMRVLVRDMNDPLSLARPGVTGGINIIDLANVHSCAFLATQDLGRVYEDGSFEVLGRYDNSDVRGCNLMIS